MIFKRFKDLHLFLCLCFQGYSFVSPSVMFGRPHALTDDLLTHSTRSSSHSPLPLYLQEEQKSPQENFFHLFELDLNGEPLGDGSFSICRRCTRISTQEDFAVKIVSRKYVLGLINGPQLTGHSQVAVLFTK